MSAHGVSAHGAGSSHLVRSGTPVVLDWCIRGTSWLLSWATGLPILEAVLCALLVQIQELEQFFADADQLRALETAEGTQLDDLGATLGLERDTGLADGPYRVALQAQAIALSGDGKPNEMIRVLQWLMQGANTFVMTEYQPASLRFFTDQGLTYADGGRFARVVRTAKPATVDFAIVYAPLGEPIINFDDEPVLAAVPFAEEGVPGTGGVYLEEDSGR